MDEIIKFENVIIKYEDKIVINNISFGIEKGEFTSLIGPNGAGKSTIMKAILKNKEIFSGEVSIFGKNIKTLKHREKAKIIGFVPQEYNIAFDFSVFDIVAMGRNPYQTRFSGISKQDLEIIEDSMKKTDVLKFRNENFNNLSGGEKQRVMIARALTQQPKILILDEATSNLDIHSQFEILELVKKLNIEDKLTVFMIMHDLNTAARFTDKMILLNQGRIIKIGTPFEIMNKEILSTVYKMDMEVVNNAYTNSPEVILLKVNK